MFLKWLIFEFVLGFSCNFKYRLHLKLISLLGTLIVLFILQNRLHPQCLLMNGEFLMIESIHVTVAIIIK